jgi:uncharacterized protein HemX
MSTLTIAEKWIAFPSSPSVPSRTSYHSREVTAATAVVDGMFAVGRKLPSNRILKLELLVAAAIVGFASFAWQTLSQESALQEASANQSRSIAQLTKAVARQDVRIASLNESVERTTRDLAAQMGRLSRRLRDQDKELIAIQSRLSRVEMALNSRQQADPFGE